MACDRCAGRIKKASTRLTARIRMRIMGRKQLLEKRAVDLNDVVSEQAKMLSRIGGEDIVVDLALGEAATWIHGDPGQVAQILMNLAINARDSMPGGGRLNISTSTVTLDERLNID